MSYFRRSGITWTSTDNQLRVYQLDAPLVERSPQMSRNVYVAESLDYSNREVFAVDNGAWELAATVRYERNQQTLMDLVAQGAKGTTLTYYPDLQDPAVNAAVVLISPLTPTALQPDPAMSGAGHQSVRLVFRRTDELRFHEPLSGTDTLFRYHAGDDLTRATFSRVTSSTAPASYVSMSSAGNGYGTVSTAKTGQARIEWVSTKSSAGPRYIPTLLLERSRKNWIQKTAMGYTAAKWFQTVGGTGSFPANSSGHADPLGGTAGWEFTDNSTVSALGVRTITSGGIASTFGVISFYTKQGTTQSTAGSMLIAYPATGGGAQWARMHWLFSSGVPTVTYQIGSSVAPPEQFRNGWWRLAVRSSAVLTTAAKMIDWYPANANTTAGAVGPKGDVYLYGPQFEV